MDRNTWSIKKKKPKLYVYNFQQVSNIGAKKIGIIKKILQP
jgi:hypothetical protein